MRPAGGTPGARLPFTAPDCSALAGWGMRDPRLKWGTRGPCLLRSRRGSGGQASTGLRGPWVAGEPGRALRLRGTGDARAAKRPVGWAGGARPEPRRAEGERAPTLME